MLIPARIGRFAAVCAVAVAAIAAAALPATGASSSTVVSATVPSATNVSAVGCLPGVVGTTDFGTVLPGSSTVLPNGCTITFGSSNSTATLRAFQRDRRGSAMAGPTTGTPLSTWGASGVVTQNDSGLDWAPQLAVDHQGRVIASNNSGTFNTRRLLDDGSPDPLFGTAGVLGPPPLPGAHGQDDPWGVFVDSAGRVVVVGEDFDGTTSDSFIARTTAAGQWDPGFGSGGVTVVNHEVGRFDISQSVGEDRSGRYLVLTRRDTGAARTWSVSRFRSDGSLDTGWGANGHVALAASTTETFSSRIKGTLVVLPDDRVQVFVDGTGTAADVWSTRLLADGTTDTSYGTGGVTVVDFQGDRDKVRGAAVDDRGRAYVAVSSRFSGAYTLGIARLNADGSPDTTWGPGGRRTFPSVIVDTSAEMGIFVEGNGDVVVGGGLVVGVEVEWFTARVLHTGLLDASFGTNGVIVVTAAGENAARSIVRGREGGFVVGGYSGTNTSELRAYVGTTIDDWNGSTRTWGTAPSMFAACLRSVAGGAAAGWTADADANCDTASPTWNAVPADATLPAATVATTAAPTTTATATLQFGLKVGSSQAPGRFLAPIAFEVVAP